MSAARRLVVAVLAATALAAAVPAVPASAAPKLRYYEWSFIEVLDQRGLPYSTPENAVNAGYAVCRMIASGNSYLYTVSAVQDGTGYSRQDSAFFTSEALFNLCPQYL